jgi:hypothetical protein
MRGLQRRRFAIKHRILAHNRKEAETSERRLREGTHLAPDSRASHRAHFRGRRFGQTGWARESLPEANPFCRSPCPADRSSRCPSACQILVFWSAWKVCLCPWPLFAPNFVLMLRACYPEPIRFQDGSQSILTAVSRRAASKYSTVFAGAEGVLCLIPKPRCNTADVACFP